MDLNEYLPHRVNSGRWLAWYTLERLRALDASAEIALPICSLGTPCAELSDLGDLVLPPLYHEALDPELQRKIVAQIRRCFPYYELTRQAAEAPPRLRIAELPRCQAPATARSKVLAFSVDTAVEEHGPHLPLATDTIQSYGVLRHVASEMKDLQLGPPVEYGQLTWGLPFGLSIDLTAPLLSEYVAGMVNALIEWMQPDALYVVDVHGSIVHREAIVAGLETSRAQTWSFRWLHEPLVEFASQRGDQHAGGVETALVEFINRDLVDPDWWPGRLEELAAGQMSFPKAVELTPDLTRFIDYAESSRANGIVGDIRNYHRLDAQQLFDRMVSVARADVEALLEQRGGTVRQDAGDRAW